MAASASYAAELADSRMIVRNEPGRTSFAGMQSRKARLTRQAGGQQPLGHLRHHATEASRLATRS
jgi:hypothetical protein